MTPRAKSARLFIDPVLASKLRDEVDWNELADLSENRNSGFGWFTFNHQADPKWDRPPAPSLSHPTVGWL